MCNICIGFGVFLNHIHTIIYPLLRELIAQRDRTRTIGSLVSLPQDAINIVWQVRTQGTYTLAIESTHSVLELTHGTYARFAGNKSPFINTEDYYKNVHNYILSHIGHLPYRLHVIGASMASIFNDGKLDFLRDTPHVTFIGNYSVTEVMDAMLSCDILFYTGSSFAMSAVWLSDFNRPIILESVAKEAYMETIPKIFDRYHLPDGRSIRLDDRGAVCVSMYVYSACV